MAALDMASWLEKQGEQKETLCDKCRKANPSHSCQDITELGRCAVEHEQKPAYKVEPRFKVGDFIVSDYCMGKVVEITNDAYLLDSGQEIPFSCKHAHLWDITKDAKDGDVLYHKSPLTGIEYIVMNRGINGYGNVDSYFRYNSEDGFAINVPSVFDIKKNNITPATKEQRDKLEKAMVNAGYKWNKKERKLEKI